MNAPNTAQAAQWMNDYVTESLSRADLEAFIDSIAQSMGADIPELAADTDIQRDLQLAVRSQFRQVLVASPDSSHRWTVPVVEEAHSLARTIARRGLELRILSQLYHAGHKAVWRFVTDFVRDADVPADFKVQLVVMMWEQTSEVMNTMLEDLAATYTLEREQLLSGAFSMRVNMVRAILDGTHTSADEASAQLGYPLHRSHVAMVLWTESEVAADDYSHAGTGSLESLATRLARSASCTEILCVPSGSRGLWAWMIAPAPDAEPVVDPDVVPAGVRVAIGRPGSGIDGFRRTHREAQAAQEIAARARRNQPVTSYKEVELVSMLAAQPDAMGTLIERELGGLLEADELSERLRETLRAVLVSHGNFEAASRLLAVHKNTVRYRMQQIEDRLGRRISERALHLELALDCLDTFGQDDAGTVPDGQTRPAGLDI
ncbi:PucR family transcriptional regulator [Tomitella biformata]|uniref:PucR family transcriptional regulator n=1 Tax=Tomitella biformata TaxID=630403 RepID=UPI00046484CA|nr:PucR family transcriptional regulator [Tomitella biformata]